MRARESNSIAEFNIYGDIDSYSEPISEADLINHGRVINDVADVIANTTSHIESKEKALINNQRFIDLLIEDSEKNIMQKAPVPQKIPHAMRREDFLFILSAVVSFVCPVICS